MGGEIRTITITLTTQDSEHLPDGTDHDDIVDQVESVINDALAKWYEREGGKDLLACDPMIY